MKKVIKSISSVVHLRIKQGPLEKYRFIAASGLSFIRGTYEQPTVAFLEQHVKNSSCCYDIGGHVGYLSLVLSKLVGKDGTVYVFEPRPININYINRHIKLNKILNIKLLGIGISDFTGESTFYDKGGTGTGKISDKGSLTIRVNSLDKLHEDKAIAPPDLIKMDIEGEEFKALCGSRELLKTYKPILVISTHSQTIHDSCLNFVRDLGYSKVEEIKGGFTALF
ncbi:MAG: FkbM family methyltransferase [Bacteroidales bacterium]|nr:FkbM family methyltransferase [Bacteroidales bacterium]MCK9558352.1 FkbM family methyltransferase [Candidatus Cloacimonadota bacterium]MDD2569727.1 FkbM family methyltransferase [Bacteroidales bacterium]MDD2811880.1 FkbM family methyltransferase [Bacteroidales bacterium]MDD3384171.1 FkbM family methyltransferase [Bacteroidales bacterium]